MSSKRYPCLDCGDKASVQVFSDGSFCYACRKKTINKSLVLCESKKTSFINKDFSFILPVAAKKWLGSYRITDQLINEFNIGWSNKLKRLIFPFYKGNTLVFSWMRDISGLQKSKWLFNGIKNKFLYHFKYNKGNSKLVITEDVISAIRCSQHNVDILALGGLNYKNPLLLPILLEYNKILVWLDGDIAGRNAATAFKKYYNLLRPIQLIKTKSDPKEYSNKEIQEILND